MALKRDDSLSEATVNMVENIAYQIAERNRGRITVNHLVPYLPMSVGLLRDCLDEMLDEHSVFAGELDGFPVYEFNACLNKAPPAGRLDFANCLSCNTDFAPPRLKPFCPPCFENLTKDLTRIAKTTGWPTKAVYEHEILYLAARQPGPHYAAWLAGQSRFTLKRMKQKLKTMTLDHYLRQELDTQAGNLRYHFPAVAYPKKFYRHNMEVIRSHPSSVMEDVEMKVTRITLTLAGLVLLMFLLALLRIPLPMLVVGFVIVAPIVSLKIWRHKEKPPED